MRLSFYVELISSKRFNKCLWRPCKDVFEDQTFLPASETSQIAEETKDKIFVIARLNPVDFSIILIRLRIRNKRIFNIYRKISGTVNLDPVIFCSLIRS